MQVNKVLLCWLGLSLMGLAGCEGAKDREAKYLSKAQAYFEEKNYDKVRVELKNVLQINPKNVEARYLSALLAEQNQDWRKMFGNLSAVVEAQPDHFDAQLKLGKLFLFSKQADKALEKAELVLQKRPQDADALALKAAIAYSNGDTEAAKTLLKQALAAQAGHLDASLLLIKLLGDEKNLSEAKGVLEQALDAHPDKLQLSLIKTKMLLAEGQTDQAEILLQALLQRFPDNEPLYYDLAKLYVADKKLDQAEHVLKQLVGQLPDKDQPKYVLIDFLSRQRGKEQAEKELDALIRDNPDNFGFKFARIGLYREQPDRVGRILEQIIGDDPMGTAGIKARNRLAQLSMSQQDEARARKLVEEVIELESRNTDALLLRAGLEMKDQDFEAAIADSRTVLRDDPESERALMILASAQLNSKNFELAEETLEKVLSVNPKNFPAAKDLARMQIRNNDVNGAVDLLERLRPMAREQKDRDVAVMLIDIYGKRQEWDKAEAIANELLEHSDAKELPHYKLAQLYLGQQKYREAIDEFRKILPTNPTAPDVLAGLVNSYLALKQEGEAEKILDQTLAANPDNPILLTMRAELHRNLKQFEDAERLFKKVVKLKPQADLGYRNLASVYLMQKQLDKAIGVYRQGLQEIPDNPSLLMQSAILHTTKGESESAMAAYDKLLQVVPDNLLAANNLASLLADSAKPQDLQRSLSLAEKLRDSKYPAFLDTYGWVSLKNGKTGDALAALESVVGMEGAIPEMHFHLGMAYLAAGRTEEARRELEKAVENDARFKGLEQAKAELEKLAAK